MSRTIRTPKIYRSRRQFQKAVVRWANALDFTTANTDPVSLINANPFLASIQVLPTETKRSTLTAGYIRTRHANRNTHTR
jgi:hypothetical protein